MPADTRENKVVEAMLKAYWKNPDGCMRTALLALADNITDEMAERGGRKLFLRSDASGYYGWAELPPIYRDNFCVNARACFAEMCRAAAGETGGRDGR